MTSQTPRRKVALVLFPVRHAVAELMPVVDELVRRGWAVDIVLAWVDADVSELQKRLESASVRLIKPPSDLLYGGESHGRGPPTALDQSPTVGRANRDDRPANGRLPFVKRSAAALVKRSKSIGQLLAAIGHFRLIRRRKEAADGILAETRPDLFLSANFHSCGRLEGALLRASLANGLAAACVLASQLVSREIISRGRHTQFSMGMIGPQHSVGYSLLNRLVAYFWTAAASGRNGDKLLMWTPDVLLPALLLGQADADPFQVPSVAFARVYAPTETAVKLLSIGKYPHDKIRMFGIPRLDEAARIAADPELRAAMRDRLGLRDDERYVLWNVEPSWEHHYCDAPTHWRRVREIAAALSESGLKTIVSLHPLCDRPQYAFLGTEFGHVVDHREGISNLYPDAAFAVSFPCSTNGFATVFGKDVLVYDWFGVGKDAWRSQVYAQEGACFVETMAAFSAALTQLSARHAGSQSAVRAPLEGIAASRRIADDLETLVETR